MVRLELGDCIEKIKDIDSDSVDAIITSPPYNYDLNYGKYSDNKLWNEYIDWLNSLWKECYRALKTGGRLIVNIQPNWAEYMPTHHYITTNIINIGFLWKAEILWEKNNYNCGYCTWGSWKSPSAPYMKYTWEFVEVFCKKTLTHEGKSENADITADEFKEWTTAKWSIAPERDMKKYNHPAMFPEELPRRLMKMFTFKGDTILDPFMGTGTTGVVAVKNDRNFIGFELDENHFKTAQNRINEAIDIHNYKEEDLFNDEVIDKNND